MKNVVLASLLAVAGVASAAVPAGAQTAVTLGTGKPAAAASTAAVAGPCAVPASSTGASAVSLGSGAPAGGQVQMSQEEYAAYNNAATQTTPAAKAAAFEAYLKAYPNSAVKPDVLQQTMYSYSQVPDDAKTLDAADRLLAVDPCNFFALVFEVQLVRGMADAATDPATKQADYDKASGFAMKGLSATKPKDTSAADFAKLQAQGFPIFYSAIGTGDLNKKDTAGAIKAFQSELSSVPVATTEAPGLQLQDTYYLAQAYYTSTPPDYLDCAYYAARATFYAPDPYKASFKTLAAYCYRKYHGADDGFDAVTAVAKDNLKVPTTFSVTPAPKPADIVANLVATTPDLATLALSDKEYVLQNGKPADADKVFDTIKGKSVEIPDAVVIAATADQLQVAVSDDAVQSKTADFTFNFTTSLKIVPVVGTKVSLDGTYASYTQTPLMITMSDASVVEKKKPVAKAPVHHAPAHH